MDSNQTGSGAHPANGRLHLMARLRGHAGTPDITRAPSWRVLWLRTGTAAHTLTTVRLPSFNPRDRWTTAIFQIVWTAHARSELREQTTVMCHLVQLLEFCTCQRHWENWLQKILTFMFLFFAPASTFRPHATTCLPQNRFSLNLIFEHFSKICREIQVSLKSDRNSGLFTWTPVRVFYHVCLNAS